MTNYTDNTVLNFGKYKGRTVGNVPATYLLYIYDNGYYMPAELRAYINANMQHLQRESRMEKGDRRGY